MRLTVRTLLVIVTASVLLYALHEYCYVPLRCNVIEKQTEARTSRAYQSIGTRRANMMARKSLDDLKPCARACRTNVNYYMIKAADFRILGQSAAAVQEYERALHYDRRPELYFNLGLMLLETDRAAGERALVTAGLFNPATLEEIPYEDVRNEVKREVSATFARWTAEHVQKQRP